MKQSQPMNGTAPGLSVLEMQFAQSHDCINNRHPIAMQKGSMIPRETARLQYPLNAWLTFIGASRLEILECA